MPAERPVCRGCGHRIAVTVNGRVWTHGRPEYGGSRKPRRPWRSLRVWLDRLYGRPVDALPDITAWTPGRAA